MQNTKQLRQSAIDRLKLLPPSTLPEVIDFIDLLIERSDKVVSNEEQLPSTDAFVNFAGSWDFEPGELDEILQNVEQSRLMELEKQHDQLLD